MDKSTITNLNPEKAKSWNKFMDYLANLIINKLSNKEDIKNESRSRDYSKSRD